MATQKRTVEQTQRPEEGPVDGASTQRNSRQDAIGNAAVQDKLHESGSKNPATAPASTNLWSEKTPENGVEGTEADSIEALHSQPQSGPQGLAEPPPEGEEPLDAILEGPDTTQAEEIAAEAKKAEGAGDAGSDEGSPADESASDASAPIGGGMPGGGPPGTPDAPANSGPSLAGSDPGQIISTLATTLPSQALSTLATAKAESATALTGQRQAASDALPEIQTPTGMTAGPAPESVAGPPAAAQMPAAPAATTPTGPPARARHRHSRPSGISKSSKTVHLSGAADPGKMDTAQAEADTQTAAAKTQALAGLYQERGQSSIQPAVDDEMLKASTELSAFKTPEIPAMGSEGVPPGMVASVDPSVAPIFSSKFGEQQARYDAGKETYDKDSKAAHSDAEQKIAEETDSTRQEQMAARSAAQTDVSTVRKDWQGEVAATQADFQKQAAQAQQQTQGDIQAKKSKAEGQASQHYADAQRKADAKQRQADAEVKRKEREAEKKKSGGVIGWVKSKVSAAISWLKDAVNTIYDGLRAAVKFVFEAAKKLASAVIEVARMAIVGLIQAYGAVLKGLVKVALFAFPEISKKMCDRIDQAVSNAVAVVNKAAEILKSVVTGILDFLASTIDTILSLVQDLYNACFTLIGMILTGEWKEIIAGLANLVTAATEAPPQFETAAYEELLGGDLDQPLAPEELMAAGITPPGAAAAMPAGGGEMGVMPTAPWTTDNVGVDSMPTEMELSPALLDEMMARTGGDGEVMFGESDDPSRSIEAMLGTNTQKLGDAGALQSGQALGAQQLPDDGLSPNQRAGVKWDLMKGAIGKWWSDNWPLIVGGGVLAIGGLIAGTILTGGGLLAALVPILQVLGGLLMAVETVMLAGYIKDYLSKGWAGDTKGGGKSLAKGLAWGVIELISLLTFKAGGAAIKGGKAAAKGARRAVKGAGRMARKGAGFAVKQGKVMMKGISSGIGKMYKSLNEMGQGLLKRTRFKGFRMKVKGRRWALQGKVNPWVTVAQGSTGSAGKAGKAGKGAKKTAAATGDVTDLRKVDDATGAAKTGKTTETVEANKTDTKKTDADTTHNPHAGEHDVNDILEKMPDELQKSPKDQTRLLQAVDQTNIRMQGVADDVADDLGLPRIKTGVKGNKFGASGDDLNQEKFVDSIMEKTGRWGDPEKIGSVRDSSRGRFDLDNVDDVEIVQEKLATKLRQQGMDVEIKDPQVAGTFKGDVYKRYHIIAKDPVTGLSHEFQVGTRALTTFVEKVKVALPSGVSLHGKNFHVVMYDVLAKLDDVDVRVVHGLDDAISSRIGLKTVQARYDKLMIEAGTVPKGQVMPDNFRKRLNNLSEDLSDVLKKLEAEQPGLANKLDTKGPPTTKAPTGSSTTPDTPTRAPQEVRPEASTSSLTPEQRLAMGQQINAGKPPKPTHTGTLTEAQKALSPGNSAPVDVDGVRKMGVIEGVDGNTVTVRVDGKAVEVSRPKLLQDMDVNPTQSAPNPTLLAADQKKYWWQFWKRGGYQKAFGPVFMDSKVNPLAAQQGYLGDCWFISSMGATARQQPDQLRRLILDNGNGTFDVTLYVRQADGRALIYLPSTKTVNMDLPHQGGSMMYARPESKKTQELWATLLEKRYAMEDWRKSDGALGFDAMDGGHAIDGLGSLSGKRGRWYGTDDFQTDGDLLSHLSRKLDDGHPMTSSSAFAEDLTKAQQKLADKHDVVLGHEYIVKSVNIQNGTVTLHNPHGTGTGITDLPLARYKEWFSHFTEGAK